MTEDDFDVKNNTMFSVFEDNINLLIKTYINLSLTDFNIAFKTIGREEIFWRSYRDVYNSNLLSFMKYLNTKERKMLIDYIWKNQKNFK